MMLSRMNHLVCFLLVIFLLIFPFCGEAQARENIGNFSKSCTDIRLTDEGIKLSAECNMRGNGEKRRSAIFINKYIANKDGKLVWEWPNGNFAYSCSNSYLNVVPGNVVLISDCKTINGQKKQTKLNLDYRIMNEDGKLKFNDEQYGAPGGYQNCRQTGTC